MTNPIPKIRILRPNPKLKGSKAWHRYNLYQDGMTVNDFLLRGGTRSDLHYDVDHGFIDITTLDNKPNGTAAQPSSNRAAALKRIQALAAKTIDNGCTEEEAFAAAIKMGELMDKYGIESSEAELKAETCVTGIHGAERSKVHESSWTAKDIALYCDCRVWHKTGSGQIAFFGLQPDVEVATYLLRVIEGAMNRAFKEFKKSPVYPSWDSSRRVRVTFMSSMASRINARLREMRTARHTENQTLTTGQALVLVKSQVVAEQFAATGMRLKKASNNARQGSYSQAAQAAGQAAGNKVHLGTGITGKNHNQGKIS
jgi:hypothetical protein